MSLAPGARADLTFTVTADDTAAALGSGTVPVLATPRVVAWAEAATVAAVDGLLDAGSTTVGTHVGLDHLAPTPIGATVRAEAFLEAVDGRRLRFAVSIRDERAEVASGQVTRAVVDIERFLGSMPGSSSS